MVMVLVHLLLVQLVLQPLEQISSLKISLQTSS
jgi:hypothetical protein